MNKNIKQITAITLVLALVVGCFATLPLAANAAPEPVPVEGIRDVTQYKWAKGELEALIKRYADAPNFVANGDIFTFGYGDYKVRNDLRSSANGDKIPSNAHSADYPGLYFYWDDKQKDDGVLLVDEYVFSLFKGEMFYLTAKNSNTYWSFPIVADKAQLVTGYEFLYAFNIPKNFMYTDGKKEVKEQLKNINMVFIDGQYKDAQFKIVKNWFNEDGTPMMFASTAAKAAQDKLVSFNNKYTIGDNTVEITDYNTALKGKKITVTENPIPGYKPLAGTTNSYTITVKCDDNPIKVVTFKNQKQWAEITIFKNWNHLDCDYKGDPTATFETNFDFTIGIPAKVKEGTIYTISENAIKGWSLVGVTVTGGTAVIDENGVVKLDVKAGEKYTVTFTNKEDEKIPAGKLIMTKKVNVDGLSVDFESWLTGFTPEQRTKIINGMTFSLYKVVDDDRTRGVEGTPLVSVKVTDLAGTINFGDELRRESVPIIPGYYWIVEELDDLAATVFEKQDPILVYITEKAIITGTAFDYDALYTIEYDTSGMRRLGYSGLNGGGEIFPISVVNAVTGSKYSSYCAHAGSERFAGDNGLGCTGYMCSLSGRDIEEVDYDTFLSALNYIEDNFEGGLESNRVITQVITWVLLGAIKLDSDEFAAANLSADETAAIMDVYENAVLKNYTGEGKIVDIAYMTCETHGTNEIGLKSCQPQLVPLYGERVSVLVNTEVPPPKVPELEFEKTIDGKLVSEWVKTADLSDEELADILNGIAFEVSKVNDDGIWTPVTTVGFVDGKIDVATAIRDALDTTDFAGTYKLKEIYTNDAARALFGDRTADELIFILNAEGQITFNYDGFFTIVNGYNWPGRRTLGYPGLNNDGDLFYIGVKDSVTKQEFASYCAHAGSKNFAGDNHLPDCYGYMVVLSGYKDAAEEIEGVDFQQFISALNYIEDEYGNLNDNRAITQTVIWALLGTVDVNSEAFENTLLSDAEKAAVIDVMGNLNYVGSGKIVDIVYMICTNPAHDFEYCQPQLVPIYNTVINNLEMKPQ